MSDKPDKGMRGGSCNRTCCQRPGALWFHHDTRKYYCGACAKLLNEDPFNKADALRIYGGPLLVQETDHG